MILYILSGTVKGGPEISEHPGDTTSQVREKHPVNPVESVDTGRTPGQSFTQSPIAETTWGCLWAKVPRTRREYRLSGGINPSNQDTATSRSRWRSIHKRQLEEDTGVRV